MRGSPSTLLSQQGGSGMTSLNLLRKNIPEWYKKLPLVLPEESALDIVKKILSVDESGVAGTQLFRVLEIPSFFETQIIPSVRVYKRCCFSR